jgi:hypothetical protein
MPVCHHDIQAHPKVRGIITCRGKMIWESAPWKQQLVRDAACLRRLGNSRLDADDCDKEVFQLERQVFIAAYTMRKLWEAEKLSSNWNHQRLACQRFPIKGQDIPDRLNWHDIDRYYDLGASSNVKMKPEEFCGRIIHSFVFVPCIGGDDTINAFYFTSDTMRRHALWLIGLADVADLMTATGKDYPSSGHWVRRANGQLDTWSGHGEPPAGWTNAAGSKRKT